MSPSPRLGVPLLALALACAPAGESAAPAADTAADEAAIAAVRDAEEAAAETASGDISFMTADAISMPPNEPALMGSEALATWTAGLHEQFSLDITYTSSDLTLAGDIAVERYTVEVVMTPKAGGDPMSETGKGIHVYERQADGSWKMTQDIWNMDSPPPAGGM